MSMEQAELGLTVRVDLAHVRQRRSLPGMHRRFDHQTSVEAAERVSGHLTHLQRDVLEAFERLGPMTDGEVERLPAFEQCSPSTVRKRRSELYHAGLLEKTGARRDGMNVWKTAAMATLSPARPATTP